MPRDWTFVRQEDQRSWADVPSARQSLMILLELRGG
jgi:hypothetical protein